MFKATRSVNSLVLISPDATRMIIGMISSGSSKVYVRLLIVINIHSRWRPRLLESRDGWFLIKYSSSTAALRASSG